MKKRKRFSRLLLILAALAVIIGGAYIIWEQRLTDITISGCSYYTEDELKALIFPEAKYFHTLYCLWNEQFGEPQEIPFVQNYDLRVTGMNKAEIVVYEKGIIGYLPYMGNYLYFDMDGYIVESSTEKIDGVLYIDGINFDYFVLNDTLPVADSNIFSSALILGQLIERGKLEVERVYFDRQNNITLYMGSIKVYLGAGSNLEEKIHTLGDILPQISDQKGTLYLDRYSTVNDTVEYIFKRDNIPTEEDTEVIE